MLGLGLAPMRLATSARGVAAFAFNGVALPAGVTLTRASPGSRFSAGGVLVSEAANVVRFDYDPATLALRGLLVEPQRSNAVLYSDIFSAGGWTLDGLGDAASPVAGPNGAPARRLTAGASSARHRVFHSGATGQAQTVHARFVTTPWVMLGASGAATSVYFNLQTGATGQVGASVVSTTMVPIGNGWFRLGIVTTSQATPVLYVVPSDGFGTGTWTATGSETVDVAGYQFEDGTPATSPIATAGAATTRAADLVTLAWGRQGVADGPITVRYGFDNGTTQDVATTVSGGTAVVPTNLARRWILRAERR